MSNGVEVIKIQHNLYSVINLCSKVNLYHSTDSSKQKVVTK